MKIDIKKIIKESAEEVLEKMGFAATITVEDGPAENALDEKEDGGLICNLTASDDPSFLIGQHGVNLQALQHIIRMVVRKKTIEPARFIVDVNSYRQQKMRSIIDQSNAAAEQAVSEKKAVVMNPMSPYERRIVHMVLAKNKNVSTESIGEGEDRKIVVKSVNNL